MTKVPSLDYDKLIRALERVRGAGCINRFDDTRYPPLARQPGRGGYGAHVMSHHERHSIGQHRQAMRCKAWGSYVAMGLSLLWTGIAFIAALAWLDQGDPPGEEA